MPLPSTLTTTQILDVFTEEVVARGGTVSDTFHVDRRLFVRSVFPGVAEVRPGDRVQGGVALKATGDEAWLYPYVFRQVCRNGAIIAETLDAQSLGSLCDEEHETALQSVREGVATCCAAEVFQNTVRKMRTACQRQADFALTLLPMVSRFAASANADVLSQIVDQFFREGDRSQFGLANAVTAVARETRDPDLRWNLEEFGGGIAIGITPRRPVDGTHAARVRSREAVAVG